MLNQLKETIRDKYLDFGFTDEQRKAVLIVFGAFIALAFLFFALAQGRDSQPTETAIPAIITPTIPAITEELIVDVSGRVRKPGVYSLVKGSRAIDALNLAGGALPGVNLGDINLAHILFDGEQIIVGAPRVTYSSGSRSAPKAKAPTASSPLSLNSATLAQLDTLPGIGPVMANRIFAYRKLNGPFTLIDDLKKVSGIGDATFAEISKLVRI
ncbi:ComEA DNA uptake protein and related DNA-binding proteins [actinobacterium SCGC AAA044-D11]